MWKIRLSDNIPSVAIDAPGPSLLVHHRAYPAIAGDMPRMTFDAFAENPRRHVSGLQALVLVGLNRIITPANRTAEVFEVLFNNTPDLRKISIDRTLFDSEPWRLWFHFGATGSPFDGYSYSYLLESHYKAWLDGVRGGDNPISVDRVVRNARGVLRCDYQAYFTEPSEAVVTVGESAHREYQKEKRQAFDECTSAWQIIGRLSKCAQRLCPERRLPSYRELFEAREPSWTATDLAVDRYLCARLHDAVQLTNAVAAACFP